MIADAVSPRARGQVPELQGEMHLRVLRQAGSGHAVPGECMTLFKVVIQSAVWSFDPDGVVRGLRYSYA